jgi:hypothetical protein
MAGYTDRIGEAEVILDELTVSCLMLETAGGRLALVAADIIAVDAALVTEVAALADFPREALIIAASHTHSGPAGIVPRLHPADDEYLNPELRQRFVALCAQVLRAAHNDLAPANLALGRAEAIEVGANRNDPFGPYDPTVHVLTATAPDGTLRTVLVHYACHPTVLGAESRLISADFPGAMRAKLARDLSSPTSSPTVMYVNGAAGDISTRFTRGGQTAFDVRIIGERLARGAARAVHCARPISPGLRQASASVPLTPRSLNPAELPGMDGANLVIQESWSPAERRQAITAAQGRAILRRLIGVGTEAIPTSAELEAWQVGEITLVTFPGELFSSFRPEICRAANGPCLIIGYANGYIGYLVDAEAEQAATYEALASPFSPGTGQRVARIAADLVRRVSTTPPASSEGIRQPNA